MSDYIPRPDDEFDTFLRDQFYPYAFDHAIALGLTPADVTNLTDANTAGATPGRPSPTSRPPSAPGWKTRMRKREEAEDVVREIAGKVQANPDVTDAQKESLGVTVRKKTKTPAPVPSTVPAIQRFHISTRGETGPWSQIHNAVVPG